MLYVLAEKHEEMRVAWSDNVQLVPNVLYYMMSFFERDKCRLENGMMYMSNPPKNGLQVKSRKKWYNIRLQPIKNMWYTVLRILIRKNWLGVQNKRAWFIEKNGE